MSLVSDEVERFLMGLPTRQAVRGADETTIYIGHGSGIRNSWLVVKRNERQTTKNPESRLCRFKSLLISAEQLRELHGHQARGEALGTKERNN